MAQMSQFKGLSSVDANVVGNSNSGLTGVTGERRDMADDNGREMD